MLRPSYNQLIKKANENFDTEEPIVRSRYSIVLAAAKRARQLVDGNDPYVDSSIRKPLSIAVAELDAGKVQILPDASLRQQEETMTAENATESAAEPEAAKEDIAEEQEAPEASREAFATEPTEEVQL